MSSSAGACRPARGGAFARAALCTLPLVLAGACWTGAARRIPDSRSPYDALDDLATRELREARARLDAGRIEEARIALRALEERHPQSIVIGAWLQEVELAASDAGNPTTPDAGAARALNELRERYAQRAENDPSAANFVLAARLETDETRAEALLARAEALDPRCAWVPYARAFLAAKRGAWEEARKQAERAEELDPGHLHARWLSSWMLARGGRVREAITAFETWTERARGDVRIDERLLLEAELDLAVLRVLDGDARRASQLLDELEQRAASDSGAMSARERMVEAATREALGDPKGALDAAKAAEELAPGELLPVVQQALLAELWLNDPAAAEAAWTRVLALARGSGELSTMLERVRARVRLERFQLARQRAEPARDGAKPEPSRDGAKERRR